MDDSLWAIQKRGPEIRHHNFNSPWRGWLSLFDITISWKKKIVHLMMTQINETAHCYILVLCSIDQKVSLSQALIEASTTTFWCWAYWLIHYDYFVVVVTAKIFLIKLTKILLINFWIIKLLIENDLLVFIFPLKKLNKGFIHYTA